MHTEQEAMKKNKVIYITTRDEEEARKIGRSLIEERLAACVNIFPIRSIYRWKGEIQKEDEVAMLIKTKAELIDEIIKRAKELHSYEVPCIVSFSIEKGYEKFLGWIEKSTK
jgi:periplasmic divalent cation tolerance protein